MGENFKVSIDLEDMLSGKVNFKVMEKSIFVGYKSGVNRLIKESVSKLKENLGKFGLENTNLANGISVEETLEGFKLTVSAMRDGQEYSMYVEYGTGVVGEGFQHPEADKVDWMYDINNHGDSGWWYPSYEEDRNSTKYQAEDGTWWAWTAGQASRPFMYHTYLWVMDNAERIIEDEIFRELEMAMVGGV